MSLTVLLLLFVVHRTARKILSSNGNVRTSDSGTQSAQYAQVEFGGVALQSPCRALSNSAENVHFGRVEQAWHRYPFWITPVRKKLSGGLYSVVDGNCSTRSAVFGTRRATVSSNKHQQCYRKNSLGNRNQ